MKYFTPLAVLFCMALTVSNIIAGKLWEAPFGIVLTSAVWLFPITYIIGDVVPEVYGIERTKKLIWLGFAANAFAVFFFWVTLQLNYPPFWTGQEAFQTVLGFTPRLLAASFCGYLVGMHSNAYVLVLMKRWTRGKWLWSRTITSTVVGEGLDSIVFITAAFALTVPWEVIPGMIAAQAGFKILYEVAATPLTYAVVGWFKKAEGSVITAN